MEEGPSRRAERRGKGRYLLLPVLVWRAPAVGACGACAPEPHRPRHTMDEVQVELARHRTVGTDGNHARDVTRSHQQPACAGDWRTRRAQEEEEEATGAQKRGTCQ